MESLEAPSRSHIQIGWVVPGARSDDYNAKDERERGARRRPVKFGREGIELVPKPSPSPADPLNWPAWRKECTFASLIFAVALLCTMKTMFVTVNAVIATELNVSYGAATALTGVPYIFGGLARLNSQILSRSIGKRGLYLASAFVMLFASLWNMHIMSSYGAFMINRIIQGIGWGTFEALVTGSISDIFFVHERRIRMSIYNAVTIISTWGFPILGGYLSQSTEGFRNQIMVVNIAKAFSIVFLIFITPETTFNRFSAPLTPSNNAPSTPLLRSYISTLRLKTHHSTQPFNLNAVVRPIRALVAPSTLLITLLTAPLLGTAFGIAGSISLLLSAMPTFLFPSHLGFLFIIPLVLALLTYTLTTYISYLRSKQPNHLSELRELSTAAFGMILGVTGLISFGLYTTAILLPQTIDAGDTSTLVVSSAELSLNTVSALFGLLVSGALVLYYSGLSHLSSTSTPSSPLAAELEGATKVWTEILVGIWIIGVPMWISAMNEMLVGLKETSIALGAVCVVVGSTVGAAMWTKAWDISRVDGRVVGIETGRTSGVQLERWKTDESFLED